MAVCLAALALALLGCHTEQADASSEVGGAVALGNAGGAGASQGGSVEAAGSSAVPPSSGGAQAGASSAGGAVSAAGVGSGGGAATGAAGSGGGGSLSQLPACPQFSEGVALGKVTTSALSELSGVAASRQQKGVLWVHNDSGDSARFFAIRTDGVLLGTFHLAGVTATDWEDIALGPGPLSGRSYLYIADIGDNAFARHDARLYRLLEPSVPEAAAPADYQITELDSFTLSYPHGPQDAESLLVDPLLGDVLVIGKNASGESPIFQATASQLVPAKGVPMGLLTTLQLEAPDAGGRLATAGDISPTGDELLVRTYASLSLWRRPPALAWKDALALEPCPVPVAPEPQGEAVGFAADGSGYFSISEGTTPSVYFYARK